MFLPAFMKLLFLLLIVLLIYNRKVIWNAFRQINKKTWLILFLIVLTAFSLRFFWVPHGQIAFYDGFNWVSQALSIQEDDIYGLCDFVSGQSCYHYSFHSWPPTYHVLLGIFFKIFGGSEPAAFHFNALLGTISVLLAFLLSYLWTKREDVSLISAFVFSFLPIFLKFSGGVILEISSVLFLLLTLVFFEVFTKEKQKSLFLLFLISLLCTVYIRPENILLPPLFLFGFWLKGSIKLFWDKKNRVFYLLSFIYFFLLLVPALFLIYVGSSIIGYEGWNPSVVETFNYFLTHFPKNLYFFINYLINPFLFLFFGVLGMMFTFMKERRAFFLFFFLFLAYFVLYSSYDEGIFSGSLERRSLILYVPLFYFFTKGILCLLTNAGEKFKKPVMFVFVLVFTASLTPTIPYILKEPHQRITTDLLLASKDKVPEDAYFVSNNTAIIRSTIKRNVVALHVFKEQNEYFKDKELFLFKDIWWRTSKDDALQGFIYENYDLRPIEADTYQTAGRIYGFGVYELIKKQDQNKDCF